MEQERKGEWFFENKSKCPHRCIVPRTKVLQVHDQEPVTSELSREEKRKIAKSLGYSLKGN